MQAACARVRLSEALERGGRRGERVALHRARVGPLCAPEPPTRARGKRRKVSQRTARRCDGHRRRLRLPTCTAATHQTAGTLAAEHGTAEGGGTSIDVRLTHAGIASLIGSSRETVSTLMTQLVRAKDKSPCTAIASCLRGSLRDRFFNVDRALARPAKARRGTVILQRRPNAASLTIVCL